jgi:uncharacterized protein (TIRG00374 family)
MDGFLEFVRTRWRSLVLGAAGLAFTAAVFVFVLPSIADPRDVWGHINDLSWYWLLALALVALLNVLTFAPPYMAALPGLSFRSALAVTTASTASTYVAPGGPALGMGLSFAMLRGWGFRSRTVTIAVTVATIWNQFMIFGTPTVALAALTQSGGKSPVLQTAALVGLAIFITVLGAFVVSLRSQQQARLIGRTLGSIVSYGLRLVRRPGVDWAEPFARFRHDTVGLVQRRWPLLTLATLAGHLSVYAVLLVTIRALGITGSEVSLIESFAAWSLVRVLGSIPITPGGFGFVELGLTGALVGFGGPRSEVVAAVLVYRFLTVAPPVALGALAGATWRRLRSESAPLPADL